MYLNHLSKYLRAAALALLVLPWARAEESAASGRPETAPDAQQAISLMRKHFGDNLPDVSLLNDDGKPVRFKAVVEGHIVVISFFYTNCRGTCPGTNTLMAELRESMAKVFGKSMRFISISVEPEVDTPEAVKEYASFYREASTHPDTPDWHFFTGNPEDIRKLRHKIGYYESDPVIDNDPTQHAAMLVIGNQATGRWATIPVGVGKERMANRIRQVTGWTAEQRYAEINAELKKNREAAAAAQNPKSTATTGQP
jgi:protein SCO1/2